MSTEGEELTRLRYQVAELERERDAAQESAGARREGSSARVWRRAAALVLVILTAVSALVAVPAMYLRAELLDTDRYVATVAPLAVEPAVQREIAAKVTEQITVAADIEATTRDALTELTRGTPRAAPVITGLAPAVAQQFESLVGTAVTGFVESPRFEDLWIRANRAAHQALVNLAGGRTDGAITIDESGTVAISSREIVAEVKDRLLQQGVGIASRIPDTDAQITLFQSPELVRAAQALNALDRAAPLLVGFSILSAVGAVVVAPRGRRRRTTGSVGLAFAVAMAVLALGLTVGRGIYLTAVPPDVVSPAAAESLSDTLISPLRTSLRLVLVVGLVIALVAFLAGPSRTATQLRRGLARAGGAVTGRIGTGSARPWQHTLARHRRSIEGAVVGGAVLLLVFWPDPTAAVALWTLAAVALLVLLVELASGPAVRRTADPPLGAVPRVQGQESG
ncbi:hypothetical protein [Arthrobacter agilis]|uniref:hypothetical protein n=1 Tax=Arthrobacter agilis TaxID=37921 RepID=UPI00277E4AD0|nr:hypothetical protein [Arthrobacter agilis]MDQ0734483.1 hypothetical protein [Arthrobacter agilis]